MSQAIYTPAEWDDYAASHLSVTTRFQQNLYQTTADLLHGHVADFGCGSGKIAPYLCANAKVHAYSGFDASKEMVSVANTIINKLNARTFHVYHEKIEDVGQGNFTSALSINSLYAWPEPLVQLRKINALLTDGATFVLATPNKQLDMERLLLESSKELIAHPHYSGFKQQNLNFARNEKAHFISMDALIGLVRRSGFEVVQCHQTFFLGGINFLILRKNVKT